MKKISALIVTTVALSFLTIGLVGCNSNTTKKVEKKETTAPTTVPATEKKVETTTTTVTPDKK